MKDSSIKKYVDELKDNKWVVNVASLTNEEKSKYIQQKVKGKIFSVSFIKKTALREIWFVVWVYRNI